VGLEAGQALGCVDLKGQRTDSTVSERMALVGAQIAIAVRRRLANDHVESGSPALSISGTPAVEAPDQAARQYCDYSIRWQSRPPLPMGQFALRTHSNRQLRLPLSVGGLCGSCPGWPLGPVGRSVLAGVFPAVRPRSCRVSRLGVCGGFAVRPSRSGFRVRRGGGPGAVRGCARVAG
jgi:hypothetical protein